MMLFVVLIVLSSMHLGSSATVKLNRTGTYLYHRDAFAHSSYKGAILIGEPLVLTPENLKMLKKAIINFKLVINDKCSSIRICDISGLRFGEAAEVEVFNDTYLKVDTPTSWVTGPRRVPMTVHGKLNNRRDLGYYFSFIPSTVFDDDCSLEELFKNSKCFHLKEDLVINEMNQENFRNNTFSSIFTIGGCIQISNTNLSDEDLSFLNYFEPGRTNAKCRREGNFIVNNTGICSFIQLDQFKKIPGILIDNPERNRFCDQVRIRISHEPRFSDFWERNLFLAFMIAVLIVALLVLLTMRTMITNIRRSDIFLNQAIQEEETNLKENKSTKTKEMTEKIKRMWLKNKYDAEENKAKMDRLNYFSFLATGILIATFGCIFVFIVSSSHRKAFLFIQIEPFW